MMLSNAMAITRPSCFSERSSLRAPNMIANMPSISTSSQPAVSVPLVSPASMAKVLIMAFICRPRYGVMPMSATTVTRAERCMELP